MNGNILSTLRATLCILVMCWVCSNKAQAQPAGTTNFYNNIKLYDVSSLWRADRLQLLSLKQSEPFPEPYGIIGKDHQRFYIHYTAVTKDKANPYLYHVQGKTRVGKIVRPFTGTITITQAGIFKPGNVYAPDTYKGYKRGKLICKVAFIEAAQAPGSINGQLVTDFCINAKNQLLYDTLDFGIDGYQNNQFTGMWTTKGSIIAQKLQYGDITIGGSEFADVYGITVPPQYEKFGWQSFVNAQGNDIKPASQAAIAEEKRQWWK